MITENNLNEDSKWKIVYLYIIFIIGIILAVVKFFFPPTRFIAVNELIVHTMLLLGI